MKIVSFLSGHWIPTDGAPGLTVETKLALDVVVVAARLDRFVIRGATGGEAD